MSDGQTAYEAYAAHQSHKANDGTPLPDWAGVPDSNKLAWEAFGEAVRDGLGVDAAYNGAYLDAVKGKAMSGAPAPSFAFFTHNRPDIASAWAAAANAIR